MEREVRKKEEKDDALTFVIVGALGNESREIFRLATQQTKAPQNLDAWNHRLVFIWRQTSQQAQLGKKTKAHHHHTEAEHFFTHSPNEQNETTNEKKDNEKFITWWCESLEMFSDFTWHQIECLYVTHI